jgi:hypothetical protein
MNSATNTSHALSKLRRDADAMLGNLEWNVGGLLGLSVIIQRPAVINLQSAPTSIEVDGLAVDGFQCLGLSLLQRDRKARTEEVLALARRCLICESTELATDYLVRASRLANGKEDPYNGAEYFSVDFTELWNPKKGKAGSLLTQEQRGFMEKCVVPLRHCIRHNNGRLLPYKSIHYTGLPADHQIVVSLQWKANSLNEIALSLKECHDSFTTVRTALTAGLERAEQLAIA